MLFVAGQRPPGRKDAQRAPVCSAARGAPAARAQPPVSRPLADLHDALSAPLARAVSARSGDAVLARWLAAPPGWDVSSSKGPTPGWKENNNPPVGVAFVNRGSKKKKQWHRWDGRSWVSSGPPGEAPITSTTETPSAAADIAKPETDVTPDAPTTTVEAQLPVEEIEPLPPPFKLEEHLAELPDMALASAFEGLPLARLRELRLVDRRFERVASFVLRRRMQTAIKKTALSSLGGDLCDEIATKLARLRPDDVFVLSDQVTPWVVEKLTGNNATSYWDRKQNKRVQTGYKRGTRTRVYTGEHKQIPVSDQHGQLRYVDELHGPIRRSGTSKMHVKSMIGSRANRPLFVETGSANLTSSAMKDNTESVVILESPGIAKMFSEYADEVVAGRRDRPAFSSALAGFNKRNPIGIRAALAPFVNVGELLTAELRGADRVLVRMFLVSAAKRGGDNQPLQALCDLAARGVEVTVVVDQGQSGEAYVAEALGQLEDAGATVHLETGPGGGGIMHDKLIFAHYPASPRKTDMDLPTPERWTVMVGSSGLTKNVIHNENYENLLIIDDAALYSELMQHDRTARSNTTYVTSRT